ncbi:MAG: NADH-quinone oxidoreductase subunit B family protein [Candidatus Bathyarchaeota archaeon]|nr:NADH-quinone oxidoreductase subunit B family protein [Candidatus Bathyarchaeota archaeon]
MNLFKWARTKSPWIIHFNTGGCNGCDIELVAALTPRFDLERFGILLEGSPRHADILVVTGPVTLQVKDRLVRIYEQMPEPKHVMAIGTCAISGAPFKDCYNVYGGIDTVLPVNAYVPGCPSKPEAIIDGIAKLIQKIKESERRGKGK